MPFIILLLLAIIFGPGAVLGGVAVVGVWFAVNLPAALILVASVTAIFAIVGIGMLVSSLVRPGQAAKATTFGKSLTEKFKSENQVEDRIWKDDMHFIVEVDGKPAYFRFLRQARITRDTGFVP